MSCSIAPESAIDALRFDPTGSQAVIRQARSARHCAGAVEALDVGPSRWPQRGGLRSSSALRSRVLGSMAAGIITLGLLSASQVAAADHVEFGIYALWVEGEQDEDRVEIDRFLECLVYGSNLNSYWHGEAGLELRGSWVVPAPASTIEWDEVSAYLTPQVEYGLVPPPKAEETPLYLVFGGESMIHVGACGRNNQASVAGRDAGIAIVRTFPLCWPTGDTLRTETQIAMHEIVETVDRVLGYGTCAAGGTCRGRGICTDPCDTFVGLRCSGAPVATWTGCGGGQVEGWLVQKVGYAGRDPALCDSCMECDFTPRACGDADPDCAAVPARTSAPNETSTCACTIGVADQGARGGSRAGLFIVGLFLVARGARRPRPW